MRTDSSREWQRERMGRDRWTDGWTDRFSGNFERNTDSPEHLLRGPSTPQAVNIWLKAFLFFLMLFLDVFVFSTYPWSACLFFSTPSKSLSPLLLFFSFFP